MYFSDSETRPRRGPLPYREARERARRQRFDEYSKACAGITVLEQLRRAPSDPIEFWQKVITWLPKLFEIKRKGEQLIREGKKTREEIDETMRLQMRPVFPRGYVLGTEEQELARARCALAKARWQAISKTGPRRLLKPQSLQGISLSPYSGGFGYIGQSKPALTSKPPFLVFHSISNFNHDSSAITEPVREQIRELVKLVELSWATDKPIVEIRLVGHTDNSGEQKYNEGLGDKRAQAVQNELNQIKGVGDRVMVVIDQSPGELKPVGNNNTQAGRARNRRVDVYVTFGVKPSWGEIQKQRTKKLCIDPRKCIKLPEESVIVTKPDPMWQPIPPGRRGKSIEQIIDEKLSRLPNWLAKQIRKAIIGGSCTALEIALGKVVGQLSESEKAELRRQCSDRAKKPL